MCMAAGVPEARAAAEKQNSHDAKMQWWRDAKYGMFVHWGPYCLYGGVYNGYRQRRGGAEWIMNRCKISVREYRAKAATFNPVGFDADSLVALAKRSGMKYIVFTTKHHDGFAMWGSKVSRFNIVDYTPYGKDIVEQLAGACRRGGLKLGFYYSQAQDWNNPGGVAAYKLMAEGWANPDSVEIDAYTRAHGGHWDALQTTATADEYYRRTAIPQIKELLASYGDVAIFFFDTPIGISKQVAAEIDSLLKEHPQIIVNDRLRRPEYLGDYKTPEGLIPKDADVEGVDWETCMNIGSSWGYKSWENQWKDATTIVRNLCSIAARGGNYLLNVGPDAQGQIPSEACSVLSRVGNWLHSYGEAIYGTTRSTVRPQWGECIRKDEKRSSVYYLTVFRWPSDGKLTVTLPCGVRGVSLLPSGKALPFSVNGNELTVQVPSAAPDDIASVIRVQLKKRLPAVRLKSPTEKYFEVQDLK